MELLSKYLELPLGTNYKDLRVWDLLIERFESMLVGLKRNLLSKEGGFL